MAPGQPGEADGGERTDGWKHSVPEGAHGPDMAAYDFAVVDAGADEGEDGSRKSRLSMF
jgi:hypothetical protein